MSDPPVYLTPMNELDDPATWGHGTDECVTHYAICDVFFNAVNELYHDSYLRRRGELRPTKIKAGRYSYDDRNALFGQIVACEALLPELRFLAVSLDVIDEEAEREAWSWLQKKNDLGKALAA
jgi:hypothetical protein